MANSFSTFAQSCEGGLAPGVDLSQGANLQRAMDMQ
jgi:hypothetical protein